MTTEQRKQIVTPILARAKQNAAPPFGLNRREMDVLFLLTEGMYVPQIAEEMLLPQSEIEGHVDSLLGKMHARSKTEAAVIAIRGGIFRRR